MQSQLAKLIIYRKLIEDEVVSQIANAVLAIENGDGLAVGMVNRLHAAMHHLVGFAVQYGLSGNLWHNYLTYLLIMDENIFSLDSERRQPKTSSINQLVRLDLEALYQIMNFDFARLLVQNWPDSWPIITDFSGPSAADPISREFGSRIISLSSQLSQSVSGEKMYDILTGDYARYGVGNFSLYNSYRLKSTHHDFTLEPITNVVPVTLDDLVGCDAQKRMLIDNTQAFIRGKRANNLLLYGDSGTGKSTCIKAIQNMYRNQGLVIIEINKHQLQFIPALITQIKNRNYRFVIFMDDLSFDDSEADFKYLKALIEGGIEAMPDNILVYATSNRRHLVRESWSDRQDASPEADDIHHSDTAEEKISLFNRFGVTIRFNRPSMPEFIGIAIHLARRYPEIMLSDAEITEQARQWGLWHGNISGRRAQQFVNHLLGQIN